MIYCPFIIFLQQRSDVYYYTVIDEHKRAFQFCIFGIDNEQSFKFELSCLNLHGVVFLLP